MHLTVTGLERAPIKFKHLFGRYVLGFKPWTHCAQCFEAKNAKAIHPDMADDIYLLKPEYDFFYLCGVGQPERKRNGPGWKRSDTNIHLAVRPKPGSTAAIGSLYGAVFTIHDAQAIPIQPLPENFQGLPEKHYRCKNFQFAYQIFDAPQVGDSAPREIVRSRRTASSPANRKACAVPGQKPLPDDCDISG